MRPWIGLRLNPWAKSKASEAKEPVVNGMGDKDGGTGGNVVVDDDDDDDDDDDGNVPGTAASEPWRQESSCASS